MKLPRSKCCDALAVVEWWYESSTMIGQSLRPARIDHTICTYCGNINRGDSGVEFIEVDEVER